MQHLTGSLGRPSPDPTLDRHSFLLGAWAVGLYDSFTSVRNSPQWGNLPILFITAAQDPNSIIRTFAAGGDDYIRKPILEPELVARVLNQLEPRRDLMSKLLAKSHD